MMVNVDGSVGRHRGGAAPWKRPVGLGCLALSLLFVACKKEERPPIYEEEKIPNPNVPHERLPTASVAFTETACDTKVEGRVTQCGTVEVPGAPGTDNVLTLAVARVFSRSNAPLDDPIVYLDGGPGGPSLGNIDWLHPAMEPMSPDRDFVFIDQRGVGQSRPNLQCYEDDKEISDALDGCYERLSENVDLSNFNSITNAQDIDLVRQAFGYEKWNLYGISYGTRLALEVMRDHPGGVRAALIDSVVPLHRDILAEVGINGYRALERVFAACQGQADCASAFPDSMGQLIATVEGLNADPADVGNLQLDGDTLTRLIFQLMYSPITIGALPRLIDDVASEDYSLFEAFESGPAGSGGGISFGMHLSLHCAEEVPFTPTEKYDELDAEIPEALRPALSGKDYISWCEHWPVDKAPDSENEPVTSDIPTLVIAGLFDPITPPSFAEAAHEFLNHSQYFLIDNESHGASLGECGLEMGEDFFADPEGPISSDCLKELPDLEFEARVLWPPAGQIDFITGPVSDEDIERGNEDLRRRLR